MGTHSKKKLVSTRPPRDLNHNSRAGVHNVSYQECSKIYIGETGHDFQVRLGEWKTAVATRKENNALFQHVKSKSHTIDWKKSAAIRETV